jgi:alkylation response protein AidB-like acyl-CoA dehydrogenase
MTLEQARRIADDVLFPAALAVDRADRVPATHLDLLAHQGFYGITDGAEPVVETLAGGCLATAFIWLQHRGCLQSVVRPQWRSRLVTGEWRAGIARAGVRPGTGPKLRVRAVDGGYVLDGESPWVTGWDMIDVIHVAALDLSSTTVIFLLVDAVASASLSVRLLRLSAVQASRTVTLTFREHFVPADRFVEARQYEEWLRAEESGSALNGFLALGVASRCVRLLAASPPAATLASELDACRSALLNADASTTPAARAAASELAMRAATTLAVQTGSRAVLLDEHPQRLVREAAFLLVFGTRPAIRDALLSLVSSPSSMHSRANS